LERRIIHNSEDAPFCIHKECKANRGKDLKLQTNNPNDASSPQLLLQLHRQHEIGVSVSLCCAKMNPTASRSVMEVRTRGND